MLMVDCSHWTAILKGEVAFHLTEPHRVNHIPEGWSFVTIAKRKWVVAAAESTVSTDQEFPQWKEKENR